MVLVCSEEEVEEAARRAERSTESDGGGGSWMAKSVEECVALAGGAATREREERRAEGTLAIRGQRRVVELRCKIYILSPTAVKTDEEGRSNLCGASAACVAFIATRAVLTSILTVSSFCLLRNFSKTMLLTTLRHRFSFFALQLSLAPNSISFLALLRALADAITFGASESCITRFASILATSVARKRPLAEGSPRLLIVGLGNPGANYERTRHNAGQLLLQRLASANGFSEWGSLDGSRVAEGKIGETTCFLAAPNSFMNLSGRTTGKLAKRFELPAASVLVLHDDLDLAPGRIKIKTGGSSGGHNGLGSIAQHLNTQDFCRLRIGIGRPAERSMVSDYVLERFGDEELVALNATCTRCTATARSRIHTRRLAPRYQRPRRG